MLFGDKNLVKVPKVDFDLKEVEVLKLGNFTIKIIETPGHTKGGVCFLIDNLLFSGDTLLKGNIGRTDLPEANKAAAIESLKKITQLPANTIVYSGHGSVTTIGEECKNNVPLQELLNGTSN
jgi:glyoxylase-like metal-dependent hydrolase (beta-lactamase superfamily II)